ncbi:MAG: MlaE family ABC transporter permease [Planctomycetota bacterium]|jgi:phospholipid/cholesterol/gamma-HCH transport system permease protein
MAVLEITSEKQSGVIVYQLKGDLTRESLDVLKSIQGPSGKEEKLHLHLAGIQSFDSFGAISLLEIAARYEGRVAFLKPSEDLKAFLLKIPLSGLFKTRERMRISLVESLGDWLIRCGMAVKHFLGLGFELAYWIGVAPFLGRRIYVNRTIHELHLVGVEAIPIVLMISFLMGVILALNAAYQLEQFGAKIFVANLVAVSMARELGPVMTAVIVAGRTGSAIAAELGTMIVTEEIDALRVTGIHPTSFLIVPKLLALIVALPCLVIIADVVAILGGLCISSSVMDVHYLQYLEQTRDALVSADVLLGLFKSGIFGLLIGLTGATLGMRLKGGAEEVGRITTTAVVISFFLIILADMVFSLFFTYIGA